MTFQASLAIGAVSYGTAYSLKVTAREDCNYCYIPTLPFSALVQFAKYSAATNELEYLGYMTETQSTGATCHFRADVHKGDQISIAFNSLYDGTSGFSLLGSFTGNKAYLATFGWASLAIPQSRLIVSNVHNVDISVPVGTGENVDALGPIGEDLGLLRFELYGIFTDSAALVTLNYLYARESSSGIVLKLPANETLAVPVSVIPISSPSASWYIGGNFTNTGTAAAALTFRMAYQIWGIDR